MWRRILQFSLAFIAVSLVAIFQLSFVSALGSWWREINLALIMLIFTLFFFNFGASLFLASVFGFWLDIISFGFFGLHLSALILSAWFSSWLLKNWLTNRSFYSFSALIVVAAIFYSLMINLLSYLWDFRAGFFITHSSFWIALGQEIIWCLAASLLLFNLANVLSPRLKPVFLEKKSDL